MTGKEALNNILLTLTNKCGYDIGQLYDEIVEIEKDLEILEILKRVFDFYIFNDTVEYSCSDESRTYDIALKACDASGNIEKENEIKNKILQWVKEELNNESM